MAFNLNDYVQVHERITAFRKEFPDGCIETSVSFPTADTVFVEARIYTSPDATRPAGMGHAEEVRGQGHINRTSAVENCETSAVGRALAMMGYEVKRGMASREEMQKVERMTADTDRPSAPRIPVDRAKRIADQAVEAGVASWNGGKFAPSVVLKAKLSDIGCTRIQMLNVDQAEELEAFLAKEKK